MSEISEIILRAIKSKRDPEVYGASYAMEMNTELAEKAAAEIASLPSSSAGSAKAGKLAEKYERILDRAKTMRRTSMEMRVFEDDMETIIAALRALNEPQHVQVTEEMLAAGAQALADDVWHPPQKFSSLPAHDQNRFTRHALLVLKAATAPLTRPKSQL